MNIYVIQYNPCGCPSGDVINKGAFSSKEKAEKWIEEEYARRVALHGDFPIEKMEMYIDELELK